MVDLSRRRLFTRKAAQEDSVRLPWLTTPERFTDLCTQCGECLQACETNIIVKGDGGFPQVDFTIDECTFCYQCADTCPESLFKSQQETLGKQKQLSTNNVLHSRMLSVVHVEKCATAWRSSFA
ncbi:ferredoxin-type protein NapF [Vibrio ponticus]|nr:ferredoxin-type protein NapF [Vibrio ponticus]